MASETAWWETLFVVLDKLGSIKADYTLIRSSALFAQGIVTQQDQAAPDRLELSIQWDLAQRVYEVFGAQEEKNRRADCESFQVHYQNLTITFYAYLNTVVVTDPDRLEIVHTNRTIWVKGLDYYLHSLPREHPDSRALQNYFRQLQQHNSQLNQAAWNQAAYDAWIQRHGPPQVLAERIKKDPLARLASLNKYLPAIEGKKIINLLGSHGTKAIALAVLGGQVTIVDISQENAQYAHEVAAAAGVQLRYIVADVLNLPTEELDHSYELVFMELGILHYFVDLAPLAQTVERLLRPGGRLILQDFHPVSTKLLKSSSKKHKVSGNYFDKSLHTTNVAFSKHLAAETHKASQQVYLRYWSLGEIVTAFAEAGLFIRRLEEEPNSKIDDMGIPKTFTLVAERLPVSVSD
ncbi:class I SAM-dependent methyltransferase [Dictyobacter kobayashii]|uniref:class I SAM-dependent methyltransferase n=1 Tax=Dictyobacter kobayashii TaxID=2014872 RepID=UPI001C3F6E79|nr:class I SAM-dependent methyltransferase [Dictyobacter kobayashii]